MSSNQKRAREIFLEAADRQSPAERQEFLRQACAGDETLLREVEDLLRHHADLGSFLEQPAEAAATEDMEGETVGPYRILEKIGEGGFGVVYVAEQTAPIRRRVALKILKPGMDSREIVARFEAERQALALMDHPNIAQVFDAGTTPRGRPYFVMELVQGVHIHDYCDQIRMSLRERLGLFTTVCRAVQHAHQKGVIHRDLKPSNVLVAIRDDRPVAKVIDFGVAKAIDQRLTDESFHTRFAQMIGTPQYMSPEQAEMSALDIDTRSDIYSLGVLLYELLTGTTPLTRERLATVGFDELRRIIREEDPPTPSSRLTALNGDRTRVAEARRTVPSRLMRALRGDLDWIVMQAIEKDRRRRYETASALAADIERHLAAEPVEAGPPSRWYRLRKFALRHRTGLAVTAVLAGMVLTGAATWLDRAAQMQEREQKIQAALANADASYEAGRIAEARTATEWAEGMSSSGSVSEALKTEVRDWREDLDMLERLDDVQLAKTTVKGNEFDFRPADRAYRDAFRTYGIDPDALDPEDAARRIAGSRIRDGILAALNDWFDVRVRFADPGAQRLRTLLDRADSDPWRRGLREVVASSDPAALRALVESAHRAEQPISTQLLLVNLLIANGQFPTAVGILRELHERHADDFWVNHQLGHCYGSLTPPLHHRAIAHLLVAIALRPDSPGVRLNLGWEFLNAGAPEEAAVQLRAAIRLKPDYSRAYHFLGGALFDLRDLDGAEAAYHRAIELEPEFEGAYYGLAGVFRDRNEPDRAIATYREAIRLKEDFDWAWSNMAGVLLSVGRVDEAIEALERAIAIRPDYAVHHAGLGNAWMQRGRMDKAIEECQRAIELDGENPNYRFNLGLCYESQGNFNRAVECYGEVLALQGDHRGALYSYAHALWARGDYEASLTAWERAVKLHPDFQAGWSNLGLARKTFGDYDGAIAAYRESLDLVRAGQGSTEIQGDPPGVWERAALAWALVLHPEADKRRPEEAYQLAREAVELAPQTGWIRSALGFACYRTGAYEDAVTTLREAASLPDGVEANNSFFLAMALWQLDRKEEARAEYDRAVASMEASTVDDPELGLFRTEAEELLGITSD